MLTVLDSKRMHNFPHHLSYDLTLPGNTLTTEYAHCILSWMRKTCTAFRVFLATSEDFAN